MKDLYTADLHLNDNPRDEYRWAAIDSLRRIVSKYKVGHLFILGDLTDEKDNHSAALVNRIADALSDLAGECEVTVLRGNHDALDPATPFFRFIGNVRDCAFTTETEWAANDTLLVPNGCWPPVQDDLKQASIVLTHQTFAGATVNGFELGGYRLPNANARIISGDVHVPQTIGQLTYVGAPTLIDFGDNYEPRVLLNDNGKLLSIKLNLSGKRVIVASGDPVSLDDVDVQALRKGDIVKVKVEIDARDVDIASIRAQVKELVGQYDVSLHQVAFDIPRAASVQATPQPVRSDRDLVIAYGKANKFDKTTIDAGLSLIARP